MKGKSDISKEGDKYWKGESSVEDLENALRKLATSSGSELDEDIVSALRQPKAPPDTPDKGGPRLVEVLILALVAVAVITAAAGTLLIGLNLSRSTESPVTPIARLEKRVSDLERRLEAIRQAPEGIETLPTQVAQIQHELSQVEGAVGNLNSRLEDVRGRVTALETRVVTPSPTPTPSLPAIRVKISPTELAQKVRLQFLSSEDGEDWSPQGEPVQAESGVVNLRIHNMGLLYKISIMPTTGIYVKEIITSGDIWKITNDPLTGFPREVESIDRMSVKHDQSITVKLAQVPSLELPRIKGTVGEGNLREAPSMSKDTRLPLSATDTEVEVLGQWGDDWRLACCAKYEDRDVYFWAGFNSITSRHIVRVEAKEEDLLPSIFLPQGVDRFRTAPDGWSLQPIEGIRVVFNEGGTNADPLEWNLGKLKGWFRLEAWAAQGSTGTAQYEVLVNVDQEEKPLQPLAGQQRVEPVNGRSQFRSIGTYYLAQEAEVIVRLHPPSNGSVGVGMIRVIRGTK